MRRNPQGIAVCVYNDETDSYESLTYEELNRKANRLADQIIRKGGGSGLVAGLMVRASLDTAVGLLGILKSGSAYLPIDPDYPSERIMYMLKDSGAKLLLTKKPFTEKLDFDRVIDLEDPGLKLLNADNPIIPVDVENPAYIIYTSGSTGEPKGVVIRHKSLSNMATWRIKEYDFTPKDRTLQLISVSFDGFGTNFYSSLLSGGTLYIMGGGSAKDLPAVRKVIREKEITNTSVVPAMYGAILSGADEADIRSLRFVVLAAEKADPRLIESSNKLNPDIMLINEYGPTENTVTTTFYKGMKPSGTSVIGRPIENTSVYILGKDNTLMPVGMFGEICISGSGLSKGYINQPELTEERFITSTFDPSQRLYKTGDTGRWLPDGNIEFSGRQDSQVKIRGYRVESGEIEAALLKNPSVKEAVVICTGDGGENTCLWAYIKSEDKLRTEELRKELSAMLPDYMIPSGFTRVDEIPRNINGKVDRSCLSAPSAEDAEDNGYTAPLNEVQIKVAKIVSEVLGIEKADINKSIILMGGNSISMMRISSQIQNVFSCRILMSDIFMNPTISKISEMVEKSLGANADTNGKAGGNALPGGKKSAAESISSEIDKKVHENIANMAARENLQISDVLTALYVYYIYEESEAEKAAIITKDASGGRTISVSQDFKGIMSLSQLYHKVKAQKDSGDYAPGSDLPAFAVSGQLPREGMIENSPSLMSYEMKNDNAVMTLAYDKSHMDTSEAAGHLRNYLELVEMVSERY